MLTEEQRRFLDSRRVGYLATANAAGAPHVVPVCYAIEADTLYIAIDQKPKQGAANGLKRLRNIAENPTVSVVVDRYDDDWTKLGWVILHGTAAILSTGEDRETAHGLLRVRYPQYRQMDFTGLPVIAIQITRVSAWGDLTPHTAGRNP